MMEFVNINMQIRKLDTPKTNLLIKLSRNYMHNDTNFGLDYTVLRKICCVFTTKS